jgi:lipopolysaccharide/colanic/teichoic acid biosynthesis glycosyltransferase
MTSGDEIQRHGIPRSKRWFDLTFCILTFPIWFPLMSASLLAVLVFSGWPAVYISPRIVYRGETARVIKTRAMVRDAARIANRSTVPIGEQRFLNIDRNSPLYTPVGRIIESLYLTEITQFLHVLSGKMSVIGNRPLPENVLAALADVYPNAKDRFLVRAGLTGPAQLVGRDVIADDDRLAIEIAYCKHCVNGYRIRLDVMMILHTILILARIRKPMTAREVKQHMESWVGTDGAYGPISGAPLETMELIAAEEFRETRPTERKPL